MSTQEQLPAMPRLTRWSERLIAITLMLVPFHAFLTVWASTAIGHFTLLRLWDEVALGLLLVFSATTLVCDAALRRHFVASRLVRPVAAYAGLTLILGVIALQKDEVTPKALGYALIINLRFLVWMIAVWLICRRSDWLYRYWRPIIFGPLAVVLGFGLLQFFVLPHDFLMHFGYNNSHSLTYVDGLTLNQDSTILRVQSTLRGSNQLGAYLVGAIGLLLACLSRRRKTWPYWLLTGSAIAVVSLTFSRSAWLGVLVGVLLVGAYRFRRYHRQYIVLLGGVLVLAIISLTLLHRNNAVQSILLHVNSHSTATITSNQGHEKALRSSLRDIAAQPLGGGPGTAGQASVYNVGHAARNTESYWLQIALELGWPGVILLGAIIAVVGHELWLRRLDGLALGLFATLAGLVVVNLFAYGWSDDTVAYIWWGLAGIALAQPLKKARREVQN